MPLEIKKIQSQPSKPRSWSQRLFRARIALPCHARCRVRVSSVWDTLLHTRNGPNHRRQEGDGQQCRCSNKHRSYEVFAMHVRLGLCEIQATRQKVGKQWELSRESPGQVPHEGAHICQMSSLGLTNALKDRAFSNLVEGAHPKRASEHLGSLSVLGVPPGLLKGPSPAPGGAVS